MLKLFTAEDAEHTDKVRQKIQRKAFSISAFFCAFCGKNGFTEEHAESAENSPANHYWIFYALCSLDLNLMLKLFTAEDAEHADKVRQKIQKKAFSISAFFCAFCGKKGFTEEQAESAENSPANHYWIFYALCSLDLNLMLKLFTAEDAEHADKVR